MYYPPVIVRAIDNISRVKWSTHVITMCELQAAVYLLLKKRTMGYYTIWDTELELSTPLDSMQQLNFIDFVKDMTSWWNITNEVVVPTTWIHSDHQTLHVYEDDSFKSYEIYEELDKVLGFFEWIWVKVNGTMGWTWEEGWDAGKIRIVNNEAWSSKLTDPSDIVVHLCKEWFHDAAKSVENNYYDKI